MIRGSNDSIRILSKGNDVILKKEITGAVIAFGLSTVPVFAATLNVVDNQLVGASGVNLGGELFSVEFVDASCVDVFNGCDAVSNFDFQTSKDATAASQALLDQVFTDSNSERLNDPLTFVNGIEDSALAQFATPWTLPGVSINDEATVGASVLEFRGDFLTDEIGDFLRSVSGGADDESGVFAVWSADSITPVPLPAGGALLLTGLGAFVALRRRTTQVAHA